MLWSYDECKKEALKYKYLHRLRENNISVINAIYKNKWFDLLEILSKIRKPNGYWAYEKCKEEALKYDKKINFINNSNGAYNAARKNNWLNDICSHMCVNGNNKYRLIYAYEFEDKSVYVGLTGNINRRNNQHQKSGTVFQYKVKTKLKFNLVILTDYIDVNVAIEKETYFLEKYKIEKWNILNKIKTGGIGKVDKIWTYERCKEEAMIYNNRTDFKNKSGGAYSSAYMNNWLDDICSQMNKKQHIQNYWTLKKCQKEALKYNSKKDYSNLSHGSYSSALKNGWLDDICSHMKMLRYPNGYWTYDNCKKHSLECKNKREFSIKYNRGYQISLKRGWLNEFFN